MNGPTMETLKAALEKKKLPLLPDFFQATAEGSVPISKLCDMDPRQLDISSRHHDYILAFTGAFFPFEEALTAFSSVSFSFSFAFFLLPFRLVSLASSSPLPPRLL